jgi:aryl carrier-like protein
MDLEEIVSGGVDSIRLAQDRDKWRALFNAVMNFGFQKITIFK